MRKAALMAVRMLMATLSVIAETIPFWYSTGLIAVIYTVHPLIFHIFTTKKSGDKSGFGDKSDEM